MPCKKIIIKNSVKKVYYKKCCINKVLQKKMLNKKVLYKTALIREAGASIILYASGAKCKKCGLAPTNLRSHWD